MTEPKTLAQSPFSPRRIDAAFFLAWGYITLAIGLLVWGLQFFAILHHNPGYLWMGVPVIGLIATVIILKRNKSGEKLFGDQGKLVGAIWSIVGPGMGYVSLFADNPMGIQLFLSGLAVSVHGAIMQFRFARFFGIAMLLLAPLVYRLDPVWGSLAFGTLSGAALFVPGHVLLAKCK